MKTNETFFDLQLGSYKENACTPSAPEGAERYIRIAMPTVIHSYAGKLYRNGWQSTPHRIPLCMRYSVQYGHALEDLTFTLHDVRTGQLYTGQFVTYDPSPTRPPQEAPPEVTDAYPPLSCLLELPRRFVCSLNVAQYVELPSHSATYDVRANSRDIVSNACRVEVVWHTR